MLTHSNRPIRPLTLQYILAISLIALMIIIEYFLAQYLINQPAFSTSVINVAGRQRMYSQHLAKDILVLSDMDIENNFAGNSHVEERFNKWSSIHQEMVDRRGIFQTTHYSPEISNLLVEIEPYYQALSESVECVLVIEGISNGDVVCDLELGDYVTKVLANDEIYLEQMDKIVNQLEIESQQQFQSLEYIQAIISLLALLTLALVSFFIFRPSINQVHNIFDELLKTQDKLQSEIKERQEAEEAQRESENLYKTLFNNAPIAIFTKDVEGHYTSVNTETLSYWEKSPIGYTDADLLPAEIAEKLRAIDLQVMETGIKVILEEEFLAPDGIRYILSNKAPLYDGEGQIIGILGTSVDISEWKRVEQALAEERTLISTIIETAIDFIYVKDKEGRILLSNPAHWRSIGKPSLDEVRGKTHYELFPLDVATQYNTDDQKIIQSGKPVIDVQESRMDSDGNTLWLSTTKVPLRNSAGDITGIVGITRDITSYKQTEEELQISKARLQGILDVASSAIISINEEGNIILFNRLAEVIFGYSLDEVLNQPLNILLPERFRNSHTYYIKHFADEDRSQRVMGASEFLQLYGRRKNGEEFPIEVGISKLKANERWVFTAVLNDITIRREIEEELIIARDEAEQSSRLKTEFLNVISHELRTPLTVMLGNTPLLLDPDDLPDNEEIAEIIYDIDESGKHLLALVNDLLDLSKIEAGKMELHRVIISVEKLVQNVVSSMESMAQEKGLSIETEIDDATLLADEIRLKQILINLMGNAIKFTDTGTITIKAILSDDRINFEVRDTGFGMSQEVLPFIFDAFRQADSSTTRAASGTGLGLAITKKLVDLHGGQISVESEVEKGSTFQFFIPLVPSDEEEDFD